MQTINEFLVSIGYDVRDQSDFEIALKKVEGFVLKLEAALLAAEAAIQAVVVKTTIAMDQANFSAMRTGSSVAGLQSLAYALEQTGRSSGKAEDLLGGFAQALRKFPGAEAALQRLGVQTREHGRLRETSALFRDAVKSMNAIPSYVIANNYAGLLGISEDDYAHLRANSDRIAQFEQEQAELTAKFGLDRNAAGAASTALAGAWRASLLTMEALLLKLTMTIGPILSPVIMHVREWIEANRDRIIAVCRALVEVALGLSRQLADLVRSLAPVADSFLALAEAIIGSQGFLFAVELVAGVWLAGIAARFLAPIALVIAALAGLSALIGATPAKAAKAESAPIRQKKGGIFARARAAVTRKRTHGASGSWGEGGATGSWWGRTRSRAMGGAGAAGSGGGKWEGPVPAPASEPDQALSDDRRKFAEEMKDPAVAARFAGYVEAEVGSQGPKAQQAFIETILNRASSRGQTLRQTLDGSYFPSATHSRARGYAQDPRIAEKYGQMFGAAMGGSNISGFATGNGSLGVKFGGGPQTSSYGGEDYGIEKADIGWARRMQELSRARRAPPPEMPPKMNMPGFDPNSMFEAPPLGTANDNLSVSIGQETDIVVMGDPDPTKTMTEVSAAQRRVNKGLTDQTEKAMA